MPHVVIGEPSQREAHISPNNVVTEQYLGVWITDAPVELLPGKPSEVNLTLMYWPAEKYEGLVPGATFTVREGPNMLDLGTSWTNGFQ
jgi:hypothetical protein